MLSLQAFVCQRRERRVQVTTLLDYLNSVVELPERDTNKPLRVPISGIYKIKGVGDVLAGRVEQGVVKPNDEVCFAVMLLLQDSEALGANAALCLMPRRCV